MNLYEYETFSTNLPTCFLSANIVYAHLQKNHIHVQLKIYNYSNSQYKPNLK